MSDLPYIVALCPTFNHPELLANSVALWEIQDYPADRRFLVISDDGGAFDHWQTGENWHLFRHSQRFPSLPHKYNDMAMWGRRYKPDMSGPPDAYLVWEDDDLYLPGYVSAHARVLAEHELSKPGVVVSDYPGYLIEEPASGRFHSTLGFRRELFQRIGGWPLTRRADFDQQMIAALQSAARSAGDPFAEGSIEFVYRWHTGAQHGQSFMRSPDDQAWYDRAGERKPPWVGKLEPRLDARTAAILKELGRD